MKVFANVLVLILLLSAFPSAKSYAQSAPPAAAAPAAPAPAAVPVAAPAKPDEMPPPGDWINQYHQLMTLMQTISDMEKDSGITALRERTSQISGKLSSGIPEGYRFDAQKLTFVRIAPPTPPAPAPAPAPIVTQGSKQEDKK